MSYLVTQQPYLTRDTGVASLGGAGVGKGVGSDIYGSVNLIKTQEEHGVEAPLTHRLELKSLCS